jgi:hypothetical protein
MTGVAGSREATANFFLFNNRENVSNWSVQSQEQIFMPKSGAKLMDDHHHFV